MRAFISVSDKTGICAFAQSLSDLGCEIIATGNTYKALTDAGIRAITAEEVTGFEECLEGRVKTLHPNIHAGILAKRDNHAHMQKLEELRIQPIDLVVVNLYPFKNTILNKEGSFEDAIENIDIGGPSMLRAAAKNFESVLPVVDVADYDKVLAVLKQNKEQHLNKIEFTEIDRQVKLELAAKVYRHTAAYDALVADYLTRAAGAKNHEEFSESLTLTFEKIQSLRYGENPHQSAAFYKDSLGNNGIAQAKQLHGKELSYNNISDAASALDLLREFKNNDGCAVVAVKHANPCGVGVAGTVLGAYNKAYACDSVSIFGGIVACNQEIDEEAAQEMSKIFLEVIIAPGFSQQALTILSKKPNIRLLALNNKNDNEEKTYQIKKIAGGLLIQNKDALLLGEELEVVTQRKPTERELADALFAWKVVKHVKSNAIVVAKNQQTLGIGGGQVNRIWATQQALQRSGNEAKGAAMASDAFFPFDDCVKAAGEEGISCIIQPGGSIRDELSIQACNQHDIAMIFTKMRHFAH